MHRNVDVIYYKNYTLMTSRLALKDRPTPTILPNWLFILYGINIVNDIKMKIRSYNIIFIRSFDYLGIT